VNRAAEQKPLPGIGWATVFSLVASLPQWLIAHQAISI